MIALLSSDALTKKILGRGADRVAGWRSEPDRIVLAPRSGVAPSSAPPVRIFVGTEPGQYRSERVLIWSIERVRDPARIYEVYLMRDLVGFDRRRWLTGFTNYRFAIPHYAGNRGRAIYNDVDQIYLGDPAELFDSDMQGAGFLALNPKDTAVMLIDCARMGEVWKIDQIHHERRKAIEAKVRHLWGPLARQWHSRDEEYRAGFSKVLHFTTIHTQPWQPFPEVFVYQHNPVGEVWSELEREADRAGFNVFTREHPSPRYESLRVHLQGGHAPHAHTSAPVEGTVLLREALAEASAATVLECGLGNPAAERHDVRALASGIAEVGYGDLAALPDLPGRAWDAVVCRSGLEHVPDEDVPWVVAALFAHARRAVYVELHDSERTELLPNGTQHRKPARGEAWWTEMFDNASLRHPQVRWQLALQRPARGGKMRVRVRQGGRRPGGRPPRVWVLADDKLGHSTQSVGLAEALGWPYEVKHLHFNPLNRLSNRLLGARLLGLDGKVSDALAPPWPDLVIGAGRRSAPVARWIGEQSGGRTRLVQLGRKGADRADDFDLSVTCSYFGLPLHTRRLAIAAPLNAISEETLREAAERWRDLFAGMPSPHVALIVGGNSAMHELDASTAERMARATAKVAADAGGSLYVVTSPRTGAAATAALRTGAGAASRVYEWRPNDDANPYLGCLALADVLIVTGDSESMLAEAAATGKPLLIHPLPERRGGPRQRLRAWVSGVAQSRPRKEKGTVRPQQGLEYICARLIERGLVRPPRDLAALHRTLIERGIARPFGTPLSTAPHAPLRELPLIAERVRRLLGAAAPVEAS